MLVPRDRLLTGSITTRVGATCSTSRCMVARWPSSPRVVGRSQWKCSSPRSTQPARSSPTEAMLRRISDWDSSKLKNSTLSPRWQAASAKLAAIVVLPVPDVPLTRTPLPRNTPCPPSISSSPATPVETRSALTCLFRPSEVIGSTSSPPDRSGTGTRSCRGLSRGTSAPAVGGWRRPGPPGRRAPPRSRRDTPQCRAG